MVVPGAERVEGRSSLARSDERFGLQAGHLHGDHGQATSVDGHATLVRLVLTGQFGAAIMREE